MTHDNRIGRKDDTLPQIDAQDVATVRDAIRHEALAGVSSLSLSGEERNEVLAFADGLQARFSALGTKDEITIPGSDRVINAITTGLLIRETNEDGLFPEGTDHRVGTQMIYADQITIVEPTRISGVKIKYTTGWDWTQRGGTFRITQANSPVLLRGKTKR